MAASRDWLTLRTPTADEARARWPIAPEWLVVQRPKFAAHAVGLDRIKEVRGATNLRRLLPSLTGYLSMYAAMVGASTLEEAWATLPEHIRDYEIISRTSFADRIKIKARRLRLA